MELDSLLWFRAVNGQFNMYYRNGVNEFEYMPDFVATINTHNLIIETKKLMDIDHVDVKAKACVKPTPFFAMIDCVSFQVKKTH